MHEPPAKARPARISDPGVVTVSVARPPKDHLATVVVVEVESDKVEK